MAENAESAGSAITEHTPADATSVPPPIVIQTHYQDETEGKVPSTTEDLWVHRDILLQAGWFQKALCGNFREASDQIIDLPEEDPAVFHFLVAFLYEGTFEPIRPAASVLAQEHRILHGAVDVDDKLELPTSTRVRISNQAAIDLDALVLGASQGVISRDVGSAAPIGLATSTAMCLYLMFEQGPGVVCHLLGP
ncbi:hypothetical protein FGSG_06835 [Fusarium graminearum PH-1]|uniref:hypothetical protein n=1 Tax=Gibberella zeae (strain ATCC MYA-4620 / CBS 123657 / FGSC 9075 / NRRL 31084 / PH-1) TaxID=229533 RepID=UPI00021F18EC|nr:hypothetical protein FGSG_06835 [Fusarium graminearum PH-1]ESU12982.1 hypothetical protein FGSG_06835 [Fusarium graminearum PH-1]|eukprot:XP_011326489.1 hypothetical protein FGSG_06835 [Fusarium graminearum PH-1]